MATRVLIVDSSYGERMILKDLLFSAGCHVVGEAKTLDESVESYRRLQPDIVIMAISVPDVDGVSGVMRLLRLDYNARVLICASRGQRALALEALRAGAKDLIIKPFTLRHLARAVHNTLKAD